MTIRDWAARLGMDPHKSRGPEDFWTICPCHNDTEPSLHVYIGGTGQVVMKCFVCQATGREVCEKLGLSLSEVMCNAITGDAAGNGPVRRPTSRKKEPKRSYPFRIGAEYPPGYKTTAIYEYQDREGRVVLRKARAEKTDETGKRIDKTFLMQSIGADGGWYATAGIYKNLLYHLPEVLEAAKRKGRIIVAEGEKDIDNLRKLGITATCGLTGGGTLKSSRDSLVGKWNDDHAKCFDGADEVIVIADNDAAGEGIAQWICKSLRDRVGTVKLVRIADHYPSLPKHGDFTDWVTMLKAQLGGECGKSAVIARLNTMIDETPAWEPGNLRVFERPAEDAGGGGRPTPEDASDGDGGGEQGEDYCGLRSYCIQHGRLARRRTNDIQILCDFVPILRESVTRDDGEETVTDYIIGGTAADGTPLPDVTVSGVAELIAMRWPMHAWQVWGNIKPIRGAKEMILDALNSGGQRNRHHRNVYAHTGMRMVEGKLCYLYAGGAIGSEHVSVEIDKMPGRYTLCDRGHTQEAAAMAELILIQSLPARIIYPMMAQAYLAPLYSLLETMHIPPSYVVFLIGSSGTGKSTVAGYVQSHFGEFYERCFPASFTDSANSARKKSYIAKDALYTVDDYVPDKDGGKWRGAQDAVANAVISAVADRAGRSVLDAKQDVKDAKPSRCTCIMTGEELPKLTSSREMRLYRIDVEPGEIASDMRELEPLREMQQGGQYQQCMRGYIEALLARWDGMPHEIRGRMEEARERVYACTKRRDGRLLDAATFLITGVGLMLDHIMSAGAIEQDGRDLLMVQAEKAICVNIDEQGEAIDAAKPERVWLRTLASLINTRTVTFVDKGELTTEETFRTGMIGYKDGDYYYIDPSAADEAVAERLRKAGAQLGVGGNTIRKNLARMGFIRCRLRADGGVGETTLNTRVGKRQMRMIWLHRWAIDGGGESQETDNPKAGFAPARTEQLPIEFTRTEDKHE